VLCFFTLAPLIRGMGGLLYVAILIVCVSCVVARRAWISDSSFLIFCAIGMFYAVGSYGRIFPAAWTMMYDRAAIPQQATFVVGFYFFVAAGRVFWADLLAADDAILRLWLLSISGFVSPMCKSDPILDPFSGIWWLQNQSLMCLTPRRSAS